jgi:hypothetical protein
MLKLSNWFRIPKVKRSERKPKYPFAIMKVGQSFFCKNAKALKSSLYRFQKSSRKKFVTKSNRGGVRVWRAKYYRTDPREKSLGSKFFCKFTVSISLILLQELLLYSSKFLLFLLSSLRYFDKPEIQK